MTVEPKHIAIFLPSLGGGGAERTMVTLANAFSERGYKTDLVLAAARGPYLADVQRSVRVVNLKVSRVLMSLAGLVRYLRAERPQALLSTLDHANIMAILASKIARIDVKTVVRVAVTLSASSDNGKRIGDIMMPMIVRYIYRYADSVVAVSSGVAEDLIKNVNLQRQRVSVIYNPIVTEELLCKAAHKPHHRWFSEGSPPVILGVGRLTPQKDFITLLKAFAIVRRKTLARLVILGEGEMRTQLMEEIKRLGLIDDVDLPGFVDNPFSYMNYSRVFALSSRWEGLPGTLIQAMACNTPVVSTDCPSGPSEILENGRWGHMVPVGNAEHLADAIIKTLNDANPPDASIRAQHFGLEKALDSYLSLLLN